MSSPDVTREYEENNGQEPDIKAIEETEQETPQVYFDGQYIRGV